MEVICLFNSRPTTKSRLRHRASILNLDGNLPLKLRILKMPESITFRRVNYGICALLWAKLTFQLNCHREPLPIHLAASIEDRAETALGSVHQQLKGRKCLNTGRFLSLYDIESTRTRLDIGRHPLPQLTKRSRNLRSGNSTM